MLIQIIILIPEGELVVRINSNVGDGEITYPKNRRTVIVETTVSHWIKQIT